MADHYSKGLFRVTVTKKRLDDMNAADGDGKSMVDYYIRIRALCACVAVASRIPENFNLYSFIEQESSY